MQLPFNAVGQAGDKTFLSLCRIGRQQERKPMHASHIFCEHWCISSMLGCVHLRSVGRDRSCSWPSPLSLLRHSPLYIGQQCQSQASMPKQLVAHVWPEFFCHVEERIKGYLLSPLVCGISKRSIRGRVVKIGNSCGYAFPASSDVLKWLRPSSPRVINSRLMAYPVRFQNPPVPFTK